MTYASGSDAHTAAAQAKLADKAWRLRNSWWILAPLLCCGFFGFVGFLVAAIRTGKRHYWVATGVYATACAVAMVFMVLAGEQGSKNYDAYSNIGTAIILVVTLAAIVHAAIKNQDYLTALAYRTTWYAQPQVAATEAPPSSFLGVSNRDYFAPEASAPAPPSGHSVAPPSSQPLSPGAPQPPAPSSEVTSSEVIDINRASASDLVTTLRIDQALAEHVVSVRNARGGYRDFDDLATFAGLQPHQLIRFRQKVAFIHGSGRQDPPTGPAGRILDY